MSNSILYKTLNILQLSLALILIFIRYARLKALPMYFSITKVTDITVISLLIIMIIRCWVIKRNKK